MRAVFALLLFSFTATACGSAEWPVGEISRVDPTSANVIAGVERGDFSNATARAATSIERALYPSVPRLYFIAGSSRGLNFTEDVLVLRSRGVQAVNVRRIELGDGGSGLGTGAARHFEISYDRTGLQIPPAGSLEVHVKFLANTTRMQSATLVVESDAQNAPYIEIPLTGKVFEF